MKKKLMPQTVAPVQRETSATVSRDCSVIAPLFGYLSWDGVSDDPMAFPFAGDDAE